MVLSRVAASEQALETQRTWPRFYGISAIHLQPDATCTHIKLHCGVSDRMVGPASHLFLLKR